LQTKSEKEQSGLLTFIDDYFFGISELIQSIVVFLKIIRLIKERR